MQPDRRIVRTHRRSDGLSTIPNDQNTLTRQSADTNDTPRDPICRPVTWNPAWKRPYSTLRLRPRLQSRAYTPPSQSPRALHYWVKRPPTVTSVIRCYPRHWQQKFCWSHFSTWFDSRFLIWFDSIVVSIWLESLVFSILFNSRITYLFLTQVTQVVSHSSKA